MKPERMLRVNEILRRELSLLFEKDLRSDFDVLVTVTGVETSPDLRHAKVFVSVLGDEESREAVMRVLGARRKRLQQELSQRVKLKYTPRLSFQPDMTAENADRVLSILEDLELEEDDAEAEDAAGGAGHE